MDMNEIAIIVFIIVNIIGWAYTIGKLSQRAKSSAKLLESVSSCLDRIEIRVSHLEKNEGVLSTKIQAIENLFDDGIFSKLNKLMEISARMDERIKDLEGQ